MFSSSTDVEGNAVYIEGLASPGIIHKDGLLLTGKDGKKVSPNINKVSLRAYTGYFQFTLN